MARGRVVKKVIDDTEEIKKMDEIFAVKEAEEKFVANSIKEMQKDIEKMRDKKIKEITEYAKQENLEVNPVVITNRFFKNILPVNFKTPEYTAESLGVMYEYYLDLITQVNEKVGVYPPSLSEFSKMCGLSLNRLRGYKQSTDVDMVDLVDRIIDEIGDSNLSLGQKGMVQDKMTIFKLKSQNEMTEKVQPNVNITYKEVVNTTQISSNIEKYKKMLEKKG